MGPTVGDRFLEDKKFRFGLVDPRGGLWHPRFTWDYEQASNPSAKMKLGNAFGEGKDQGDRCKRCFSLKEYPSTQNKQMNETPSKTAKV